MATTTICGTLAPAIFLHASMFGSIRGAVLLASLALILGALVLCAIAGRRRRDSGITSHVIAWYSAAESNSGGLPSPFARMVDGALGSNGPDRILALTAPAASAPSWFKAADMLRVPRRTRTRLATFAALNIAWFARDRSAERR